MFEIETGVPVPPPRNKYRNTVQPKYPFQKMNIGDSFVVYAPLHKKAWNAARVFKNRHGIGFRIEQEDDHFRIWRTS